MVFYIVHTHELMVMEVSLPNCVYMFDFGFSMNCHRHENHYHKLHSQTYKHFHFSLCHGMLHCVFNFVVIIRKMSNAYNVSWKLEEFKPTRFIICSLHLKKLKGGSIVERSKRGTLLLIFGFSFFLSFHFIYSSWSIYLNYYIYYCKMFMCTVIQWWKCGWQSIPRDSLTK